MTGLFDFLQPSAVSTGDFYSDGLKIGNKIKTLAKDEDFWHDADIVICGCGHDGETEDSWANSADAIRETFFNLYDWHQNVSIADLGNIRRGASPKDTHAALIAVLKEIHHAGKTVILLGENHELTYQQYKIFEQDEQLIEAAVLDRFVDLKESETITSQDFLMPMLTEQPNFIRHFSLLGFQTYDNSPKVMETLDKLRFDCLRLGRLRERLEEAEPMLRNCDLISIDLNVLRASEAGFLSKSSPNGLFGDELCQLTRYAGMSNRLSSFGIYGYNAAKDTNGLGAQLIAQTLWYFIDGYRIRLQEAGLEDRDNFLSYYVSLSGTDMLFLKSKRTGRWWMQLSDLSFTPCSYDDYVTAGNNDIPERWLRIQERIA